VQVRCGWVVGAAALALTSALLVGGGASGSAAAARPVAAPATAVEQFRPDIVFILMDDFSVELLSTMPHAMRMSRGGATFVNAFVVDSLCCPSRASIFTGMPPHLTGVLTNAVESVEGPLGGYQAFQANGNVARSFNVALSESGYTTGFVGKYLNGYDITKIGRKRKPPPRVPGWKEFAAILRGGYDGWGFWSTRIARSGKMDIIYHHRPRLTDPKIDRAYATNVAARKAVDFIRRHRGDAAPYFLEVAVYGPHSQAVAAYPGQPLFPSAMADRAPASNPLNGGNCGLRRCRDLQVADLLGYADPRDDNAPTYLHDDGTTEPAPAWRTNPITLTDAEARRHYRNRARMVQSIDRLIARVRKAAAPGTYVVLTSDNGFHLGQHQINGGKGTPYDSDTRVPLVVIGPDVVAGTREQYVSNVDLASTFEQLAGLEPASWRAGIGIASLLRRPSEPGAGYVFFEHTRVSPLSVDPDLERRAGGDMRMIPSYVGVRSADGLLVRFDLDPSWTGERYAWELYRYDVPWEDVNVFATDHDEPWAEDLMQRLLAWPSCSPSECRELRR
jgi:arylsulfatase A-like enzyme